MKKILILLFFILQSTLLFAQTDGRDDLKDKFERRPAPADFADLIDAGLNYTDDGNPFDSATHALDSAINWVRAYIDSLSRPGFLELGDEDYTVNFATTPKHIFLTEELTQSRTVTLPDPSGSIGKEYWFVCNVNTDSVWIIGTIGFMNENGDRIKAVNNGSEWKGIFFPAEELELDINQVYVAEGGTDNATCGADGAECASIEYAVEQRAQPGQIVRVKPGTYSETNEITVPIGVSVVGSGIGQTIVNGGSQLRIFNLISSAPVKSGGHRIAKMTLNGNSRTVSRGIWAEYRSDITIDSVRFENFDYAGVEIKVTDATNTTPPANYLTGIEIINNIFSNCSKDDVSFSTGAISISALSGGKVNGNVITEDEGYGIKFTNSGWYINTQFNNNTITVPDDDVLWVQDICMELWNLRGGNEIAYNTINTWFSLVRGNKGNSTWAVRVHDNEINQNAEADDKVAIEIILSDVEVYDNVIDGYGGQGWAAIWSGTVSGNLSNIYIHENIATTTQNDSNGILLWGLTGGTNLSDIEIVHNTFQTRNWGIQLRSFNNNQLTVNNLDFKYNIVTGDGGGSDSGVRLVGDDSGPDILTINTADISRNVFYNFGAGYETVNNASNVAKTNYSLANNYNTNPNLDGNFEPQAPSDAIGNAVGSTIGNDIGAVQVE